MVANLSSHKRGWDARWEEFSNWAEKGKAIQEQMMKLVDEDTNSFNKIMDAFGLPKGTDEEKAARKNAIQEATKYATEIPFKTMQLCYESMAIAKGMAEIGNPNSVTDAGVGALAARAGVIGAFLNVKINAAGLDDKAFAEKIIKEGELVVEKAKQQEEEILQMVHSKI
jgi:glutamate formiminotransferase/formiminotetrahydrofolate cyclodeaminase